MMTEDIWFSTYLEQLDSIPGWFYRIDALVFLALNKLQNERKIFGDLLEIGAYKGKSAILLGHLAREGEKLVVCDTFEDVDELSDANRDYVLNNYEGLTRASFEEQYLRFHSELPSMNLIPSERFIPEEPAGRYRFVHIDGSHEYEVVRQDVAGARRIVGDGGVVVFDDWSWSPAPGVALAIWESF